MINQTIYTTTVTQKGQITLPKPIRDALKLKPKSKIVLQLKNLNTLEINLQTNAPDIMELAGTIETPPDQKHISPEDLRKHMETHYERF